MKDGFCNLRPGDLKNDKDQDMGRQCARPPMYLRAAPVALPCAV